MWPARPEADHHWTEEEKKIPGREGGREEGRERVVEWNGGRERVNEEEKWQ